jgi:hypothetical protein
VIDTEDLTTIMLRTLLALAGLVPEGFVIESHVRYDELLGVHHRSVRIRPPDVDPDTFTFGTPGAYASLTAKPTRDGGFGYHVHVFSTRVAWTFQQAGRVVTFIDPADAIATALWLVRDEIAVQKRPSR